MSFVVSVVILCKQKLSIAVKGEGHSKKAYHTFLLPLETSKHSFGFFHTLK